MASFETRPAPPGSLESEIAKRLDKIPLLAARELVVQVSANGVSYHEHGLERPYRGALHVASSTQVHAFVLTPEAAKAAGADPSRTVALVVEDRIAAQYPSTIHLLVF